MKQEHLASLPTKETEVNNLYILYIPFLLISNQFISKQSWHVKFLMLTQPLPSHRFLQKLTFNQLKIIVKRKKYFFFSYFFLSLLLKSFKKSFKKIFSLIVR